jgi:hypothetical protein
VYKRQELVGAMNWGLKERDKLANREQVEKALGVVENMSYFMLPETEKGIDIFGQI